MVIRVSPTTDPTGLELYDPVQRRRLYVETAASVRPTEVDTDAFPFPLDVARAVETSAVSVDKLYQVDVHDGDGQTVRTLESGQRYDFDGDTRFVSLTGPMKVYCRIDAPGFVETGIDSLRIAFDDPAEVALGARSVHERPAATVQTPADPESMLSAVSALSSALKTTSPERSWPTLRGHPPLLELGPELSIPSVVESPNSGVTIRVPATYRDLYTVAPLAFYLGATLRPGREPAIETGLGTYELDDTRRLEDAVARTLKRVFLLDCLVRTEGLYRYHLFERARLESNLPFDLAATYDDPLPVQLEKYFDVPYDVLEPFVPRWPLTAHVPSTADSVEILPFVLDELGLVREPRGTAVDVLPAADGADGVADAEFVRSAEGTTAADATRSPGSSPASGGERQFVEPVVVDESVEHAWFGEDTPVGASKATVEAFRSQLERTPPGDAIEILVVCNDARMLEEHDSLDAAYGSRDRLPFDVTSQFGVSTDELAALLVDGGYDFVHYIGHATPDGLRCADGDLDVRTLDRVDLGVFFLNACRSYEQALALTRRGAFGGVATVGDVVNTGAVEAGETMARLLNFGFPLRAAVENVRTLTMIGDQYLIVGDGSADIAQFDGGGPPSIASIESEDGQYRYELDVYPTSEYEIGTAFSPTISTDETRYLTPGTIQTRRVDEQTLQRHLLWTNYPVLVDGAIHWNDGFSPIDLS